jgi:hypothetical protein
MRRRKASRCSNQCPFFGVIDDSVALITSNYYWDQSFGSVLLQDPPSWPLPGTVPAPVAGLSPTTLTFSNQNISTTSAAQNITLSNSGTASLSISGISTSGDFAESNNCGTSVANAASRSIQVIFTPAASGARAGSLTVQDNAAGSPQTVTLSGTGVGTSIAKLTGTSGSLSSALNFTVTIE